MNNPVRAAHQHHREAAWFKRLAGGDLSGQHVLEVGCGQGVGAEVILDRLGAANVTAFDLDESMVDLAQRRLHGRRVSLSVGDVCDIELPSAAVDTVVDFGIIHHVPNWQESLGEIARVLRPAASCCSRKSPDTCWTRGSFAHSPCTHAKTGSKQTNSRPNWHATGCTAAVDSSTTSAARCSSGRPARPRGPDTDRDRIVPR